MRKAPEQREQTIEQRERGACTIDPAPRLCGEQRRTHLARASVRDCVVLALVPFLRSLPFAEIENDRRSSAFDLIREIAIVCFDRGDHLPQRLHDFQETSSAMNI